MKLTATFALLAGGFAVIAIVGGNWPRSAGTTTSVQDLAAATPDRRTTTKLAAPGGPASTGPTAAAETSSPQVDMNALVFEIHGTESPVSLLMTYLPAARSGDAVAQYRVATILQMCIYSNDSRAETEKRLRAHLDASTDPEQRAARQKDIDRCSPIWRSPPSETGARADWLRKSAEAGFAPALLEAASDTAIEQTLEQRNAKVRQALESRSAHVAAVAATSLYYDEVSPDGNFFDRLPHANGAVMRGLLAGCALGDDCSMASATVKAYCQRTACPPAKDLIDLFSRELSPAEYDEARRFTDAVLADLQAGRIKAAVQPPGDLYRSYRVEFGRDARP